MGENSVLGNLKDENEETPYKVPAKRINNEPVAEVTPTMIHGCV